MREKQSGKGGKGQQGEKRWRRREKSMPFATEVGKLHVRRGWSFRERVRKLRVSWKTYSGSNQYLKENDTGRK